MEYHVVTTFHPFGVAIIDELLNHMVTLQLLEYFICVIAVGILRTVVVGIFKAEL